MTDSHKTRLVAKLEEARERFLARANLTDLEQLKLIAQRRGESAREKARLLARLSTRAKSRLDTGE